MKTHLPATNLFGSHVIELHYVRPLFHAMKSICSSKHAEMALRSFINPKKIGLKEFFWVMLLTGANRLLAVSEVSVGCSHGVAVNLREIFQLVWITNASTIIVAHNHPGGTLKPSEKDIALTHKLQKFAKMVDVSLLDHIILTSEGYRSLSDEGLM